MAELVFVEQRPNQGREVEATPDAVIGREGTDIVVPDPEVSRRHAAVRRTAAGMGVEDLGSTNGTFVNDRRINGLQALNDGDTVRFGNTVFRVQVASSATRVGAPALDTGPQVTAARPVPVDLGPPSPAPQAPVAAPPQPAAPAQPAAPSPAIVGARGDVPAPPEVAPSAVRRVLPPPGAGQAHAFSPPSTRPTGGGSAATRVEATIVCLLIVLAVAVALAVYFASQS